MTLIMADPSRPDVVAILSVRDSLDCVTKEEIEPCALAFQTIRDE
jgi:hypothetical protein